MAQSLPPWLDFSPQTFVAAAESGRRAGQEDQRIALERQSLAQSAANAAAELGVRHQQLQAQAKQQAVENQVAHEQMQQNFLLDQTKLSVNAAYQQQQNDFRKQQLALAHADRLAAIAARARGQTPDSVKITDPASPGAEAVPGDPAIPASNGYLGGWLLGLGKHPAVPATPGTPAVPAHPARTFTYHVPSGTTAADAFRMADAGNANTITALPPVQERTTGTQDSTLVQPAPTNAAPVLKFKRNKAGDFVVADDNS